MKNKIWINIIKYYNLYQILMGIVLWIVMIFLIKSNIILAEEISETHQRLRNMTIEEICRDYYRVEYIKDGGPYRRPTPEDIALTENYHVMQSQLIHSLYNDYLLRDYPIQGGFTIYCKNNGIIFSQDPGAYKTPSLMLEDYITPKSPVMRLAYCIKAENIYYLTQADILGLKPILDGSGSDMTPILLDILNNTLKYGYYTLRIIPITAEVNFERMQAEVEVIQKYIGTRPFMRHLHYDLTEQQIIYNICKDGYIPKERLVDYFQSEIYAKIISKMKNNIFKGNAPF